MQKSPSTPETWNFNKEFLRNVVNQGKETLKTNNLSRKRRQSLRIDIETFERFIQGDFELKRPDSYRISLPKNIDKLKEYILTKMIKLYKTLGKDLIKWLMFLSEEQIFKEIKIEYGNFSEIPLEEQVELTLKNYEKNSPIFLETAKNIILDKSINQIQVAEFMDSYCHHDSITGQSFIIINPQEEPCIFNHEVQHAVEMLHKYPTSPLYCELGPIYHELLFIEELYQSKGYLKPGDYDFRIDDLAYLLHSIYFYFQILLRFENKNFDVTTDEFLKTFLHVEEIKSSELEVYLREEIATNEVIEDLNYILSILKAIELKEIKSKPNNNQTNILESLIKRKAFNFTIPKDNYKVYQRYIEEMEQKTKKKIKK